MESIVAEKKLQPDKTYFLSELLGAEIFSTYDNTKRIGKLSDVVIVEKGTIPHVTELVVSRAYGAPTLTIPIEKINDITGKKIIVAIESLAQHERKPAPEAMLLADYILDKKVIDTEGREISVVYDVKIIQINKKLYVSDVDMSKYGFFKRTGLKKLAALFKIREDMVSWKYVQPLPNQISSFKGALKLTTLKAKLADIPPVDMADIIEELNQEHRTLLLSELEPAHASDTFEEVDPNVQREIVSSLDKKVVARLIDEMTPAQAADVLSALPYADKENLFAMINPHLSEKIRAIFNQQEESILNYLTDKFIRSFVSDTVERARYEYRAAAPGTNVRHYVYVVDSADALQGIIDVAELLTHEGDIILKDIMTDKIISLTPQNTLKDASEIFIRYGFRAIPILDEAKKILGVILHKDVMNLKHRFV
ncbi:MAG: CBS domain-containing protein [Chitinivibrionales bacterium]|nr:CBS domain-containing protein [Chitinivibrionales bacterium]